VLATGGLLAVLSSFVGLLDQPRRDFVAWRYLQVAQQELTGRPIRRAAADHDLKRALALGGTNPLLLDQVALLLTSAEDWPAALDALSRTQLNTPTLRTSYGECLIKTGRREEGLGVILQSAAAAQVEHNRRLVSSAAYAEAANDAGYLLVDADAHVEAGANLIAAAVSLAPLEPSFCDSLGWALHKLHRNDEAIFYLERSVRQQLPSPDPALLYHLGAVYALAGRPAEAQRMLDWSLRDDPENTDAREELRRLHRVLPSPAWALAPGASPS
jgi:tetratricopeptide (TPR) repeat protein